LERAISIRKIDRSRAVDVGHDHVWKSVAVDVTDRDGLWPTGSANCGHVEISARLEAAVAPAKEEPYLVPWHRDHEVSLAIGVEIRRGERAFVVSGIRSRSERSVAVAQKDAYLATGSRLGRADHQL